MSVTKVVSQEKRFPGRYDGWVSVVVWDGCEVEVEGDRPCDPANCALGVMHHFGDSVDSTPGLPHYCPTGFLFCGMCCGIADEPGTPRCTLWGEKAKV